MKTCSVCKSEKNKNEFHKKRSSADGLNYCCKDCKKIIAKQYYEKNKEKVLQKIRKNYFLNLEQRLAYAKKYNDQNKEKYRGSRAKSEAKRRALKLQTEMYGNEELNELVFQEAYSISKLRTESTGVSHHVDHILPLNGKDVCGFHVWNNLRVIPAFENISKSNSLREDLL